MKEVQHTNFIHLSPGVSPPLYPGDVPQSLPFGGQIGGQNAVLGDNFRTEKGGIGGQKISADWLDIEALSRLIGKNYQACKKDIQRSRYKLVRYIQSRGGASGKRPLIHITDPAIPPQAQIKWIEQNQDIVLSFPDDIIERFHPQAQWEIIKLKAPKEESNGVILNGTLKEKLAKKIELIQKALSVPSGWKKSKWIEKVAQEAGITCQSLYEYIKRYRDGGIQALIKPKEKKGPTVWSPEALDYMQGVYLKAVREGGEANKLKAYEATIAEARKKGWKIGSKSSAYEYLSKLNPLLEKYARGGKRAIDNVFYIIRQYHDLKPFEVIVGDQHRFDFFVHDRDDDRVFRPEGYFWLDLRTRLCYGFSIGERYDSYFMGLALRMGLKRFGKFGTIYTDNGKPETSRYVNGIISDLKAFGMDAKDLSELYKTKDGYVIETDEGEIVDVVQTVQAWRKFARPYNAKAKPIERFFQTIEKILLDLGVPGHVKELCGTSDEKALSDERIKGLADTGRLLSPDEFIVRVFQAVEIYEARRHTSLKRSPIDELMRAVKNEGFTPRMIVEPEIDLILLKRDIRSVQRGRILLNHLMYEGEDLKRGLWDVPDKTRIEVRYDPFDPERVIAIRPDGRLVELRLTTVSSMKDPELTSRLMERKRRFIAQVKEEFKKLTAPVKGIIEYSKYTKQAIDLKKAKPKQRELSPEELKKALDQRLKEMEEYEKRKRITDLPRLEERRLFESDFDRYKYLVHKTLYGYALSSEEEAFMERYESRMDPRERMWWEEYVKNIKWEIQRRAECQ